YKWVPRLPTYPISATKCPGSSRWIVRSHSWTDGFLRFGSNAPIAGAKLKAWLGGARNPDRVRLGAGTLLGNPPEIRLAVPLGAPQPAVVESVPAVFSVLTQFSMNPGILPAIEVIWKVEMVSKSQPYPARTAVFWSGDQAIPTRGPSAPRLLFLYHPSPF